VLRSLGGGGVDGAFWALNRVFGVVEAVAVADIAVAVTSAVSVMVSVFRYIVPIVMFRYPHLIWFARLGIRVLQLPYHYYIIYVLIP